MNRSSCLLLSMIKSCVRANWKQFNFDGTAVAVLLCIAKSKHKYITMPLRIPCITRRWRQIDSDEYDDVYSNVFQDTKFIVSQSK